jgi:hypothetical protein
LPITLAVIFPAYRTAGPDRTGRLTRALHRDTPRMGPSGPAAADGDGDALRKATTPEDHATAGDASPEAV